MSVPRGSTGRTRHSGLGRLLAVLALPFVPVVANAQAVCTGPHSTPTVPATGIAFTEAPGDGWAQLTLYHQDTRDQYGTDGSIEPLFGGTRAITTSVFLTGAVGVLRGIDLAAQLPVHRLRIDARGDDLTRTGLGDVRVHARVAPEALGLPHVPVALRAGVKLPGSDFPVDPNVLPLTEGQRDWEIALQFGWQFGTAFDPHPIYVLGWAGYRWREMDEQRARKPGDERIAYLSVGTRALGATWEVAVDGQWGAPLEIQGLRLETSRRRIIQLFPQVSVPLGPGELKLGGRLPMAGRNLPAGPAATFSYAMRWGAY